LKFPPGNPCSSIQVLSATRAASSSCDTIPPGAWGVDESVGDSLHRELHAEKAGEGRRVLMKAFAASARSLRRSLRKSR
jgi:hypothetical protein